MGDAPTTGNRDAAEERARELLDDQLSAVAISNPDWPERGVLVIEPTSRHNLFRSSCGIVSRTRGATLVRTVPVDGSSPDLALVVPTLCGAEGFVGEAGRIRVAIGLAGTCARIFGVRRLSARGMLDCLCRAAAFLPGASLADIPILLDGERGRAAIGVALSLMPDGVYRDAAMAGFGRRDGEGTLESDLAYLRERLGCLDERMPFGEPSMGRSLGRLLVTGHIVLLSVPDADADGWRQETEDHAIASLLRDQCLHACFDTLPDSDAWRVDAVPAVRPDERLAERRMRETIERSVRRGNLVRRNDIQARIRLRRELLLAGDVESLMAEFG